jgi:hypothetical protein
MVKTLIIAQVMSVEAGNTWAAVYSEDVLEKYLSRPAILIVD